MFGRKHEDVMVVDDDAVLEGGLGEPDSIRLRGASALAPRVDAARVALTPYAVSARGRVVPVVAGARDRVLPTVAEARNRVVPAVAEARESLTEALTPAGSGARRGTRAEARYRSAAALAALRGELPRRHRHWPMALFFLLVGAGAGAVASVLSQRSAAPSEPTYIRPDSTPPPAPTAAASAHATSADEPAVETTAAHEVDQTVSTESGLGWPEQLDDTLAQDSSETHKPTV